MFRLISIFITLKFIPIAKVRTYQLILDASQRVRGLSLASPNLQNSKLVKGVPIRTIKSSRLGLILGIVG
jgi:hypothetical protein